MHGDTLHDTLGYLPASSPTLSSPSQLHYNYNEGDSWPRKSFENWPFHQYRHSGAWRSGAHRYMGFHCTKHYVHSVLHHNHSTFQTQGSSCSTKLVVRCFVWAALQATQTISKSLDTSASRHNTQPGWKSNHLHNRHLSLATHNSLVHGQLPTHRHCEINWIMLHKQDCSSSWLTMCRP